MFRLIKNMTKKDFIYLVVILVIVIVFQFLRGNLEASEVVNVISIGAGLTSIFLAMVAIEFSFKQSDEAKSQGDALTQVLYNINGKIQELEKVKDELNWVKEEFVSFRKVSESHNSEMIKGIQFIQRSIGTQFQGVAEKITADPEIAKSELNDLMDNLSKSLDNLKSSKTMSLESELEAAVVNAINLSTEDGQEFSFSDLVEKVKNYGVNIYEYHPDDVMNVLDRAEQHGLIKRIDKSAKGMVTVRRYLKKGKSYVLIPVDDQN